MKDNYNNKTNKKPYNDGAVNTNGTMNNIKKEESVTDFGYYSKILKKPFDSIKELRAAEDIYFAEQRAKADKAAQKKADAQKVEDAFKALNTARKAYKDDLTTLTKEYGEALKDLKDAFELGKKDIHEKLATAEDKYSTALKAFTEKYPEGYHLTLKDGDFETTISSQVNNKAKAPVDFSSIADIFEFILNH